MEEEIKGDMSFIRIWSLCSSVTCRSIRAPTFDGRSSERLFLGWEESHLMPI
jgi:hypothetical protein